MFRAFPQLLAFWRRRHHSSIFLNESVFFMLPLPFLVFSNLRVVDISFLFLNRLFFATRFFKVNVFVATFVSLALVLS